LKNNILFYQHYVNSSDHPKFKTLRVKYGWAGEGKFWALNNKIADAENCELNLSKKYNKASIANDLNFSIEEFDGFLEYLEEDCDLIIRENNHITTKMLRENLEKVMKERKRNKNNYNKRVIQNVNEDKTQSKPIESEIKPVENIQSKVKESKVKESKVKESKVKESNIVQVKNHTELYRIAKDFLDYQKNQFGKAVNNSPDNIQKSIPVLSDLIRLDGFSIPEIIGTLNFASNDDFWAVNVQSILQLRKKKKNEDQTKFQKLYSRAGKWLKSEIKKAQDKEKQDKLQEAFGK